MKLRLPFLDLSRQIVAERPEIDMAIDRVLRSGQVLLGPELEAFEREFAAWNEVEHAVGVSSGCDAIALLLRAAGIGPGDEVIVPAFTCPATWMGVCQTGARPVPAEVNARTGLLDPLSAQAAITPATRAILAVHLYGAACPLPALAQLCRERGLWLFIDAAQSTGLAIGGRRSTALGDGAAFSFYPTKNLAALDDAGAVVTPHPHLAEAVRSLRNYGKDAAGLHQGTGINARMGELQAALLRMRLPKVDHTNRRRQELAKLYLEQLADVPGLQLPPWETEAVWHLFAVRIQEPRPREQVAAALARHGIGTAVHYREAFHTSPAFREGAIRYPQAERWAATVLSLPLHPWLEETEGRAVCETLRAVLTETE